MKNIFEEYERQRKHKIEKKCRKLRKNLRYVLQFFGKFSKIVN